MKNESTFDYIDRYLTGNLSEQERLEFESRLNNDFQLKQEFEEQKLANQMLIESRLQKLRNTMRADIRSGKVDKALYRRFIYRGLWTGLGIGILIVILFWKTDLIKDNKSNHADEELINKNVYSSSDPEKNGLKIDSLDKDSVNDPVDNKNNVDASPNSNANSQDDDKNKTGDNKNIKFGSVDGKDGDFNINDPNLKMKALQEQRRESVICRSSVISAQVRVEETCIDKQVGELELFIEGGKEPYTTSLYKVGNEVEISRIKGKPLFGELPAGKYEVTVLDRNGCVAKFGEFKIKELNCKEENAEEYSFRPESNEHFKFLAEGDGTIIIFDDSGKEIVTSKLHKREDFIWEGVSRYGEIVKGIFPFTVTYKNGTTKKGYITVY